MDNYQERRNHPHYIIDDRDRPIQDFSIPTLDDLNPGIVRPDLHAIQFELKPVMFQMLQTIGQFRGLVSDNPYHHLKAFGEVSDSFNFSGVSVEALRLKLFPYSLRDRARDWLNSIPPNTITTWGDLAKKFIMKYHPPVNSHQWHSERVQPTRGTSGVYNLNEVSALNAKISMLENTIKAMNKPSQIPTREVPCDFYGYYHDDNVYPTNPESEIYVGYNGNSNLYDQTYNPDWRQYPNFQWNSQQQNATESNRATEYYYQGFSHTAHSSMPQEESEIFARNWVAKNDVSMQNLAASIKNIESQMGQLAQAMNTRNVGQLPSDIEVAQGLGKEHYKAMVLSNGREIEVPEKQQKVEKSKKQDEPGELETLAEPESYDEPEKCIPAPDAAAIPLQQQGTESLKKQTTVVEPEDLEEAEKYNAENDVVATPQQQHDEVKIQRPPPQFPQGLQKNNQDRQFKKLGIREPRPTTVTFQLTDRSITHPKGKIEDVLLRIDKFIFPVDFLILDYEADHEVPIIVGRFFLATGRALIDEQKEETQTEEARQIFWNNKQQSEAFSRPKEYPGNFQLFVSNEKELIPARKVTGWRICSNKYILLAVDYISKWVDLSMDYEAWRVRLMT